MANLIDFDHSREGIVGFVVEGFAPIDLELAKLNKDISDQTIRFGAQTKCRNATAQVCSEAKAAFLKEKGISGGKMTEAQETELLARQRPVAHSALQAVVTQLLDGKWIGPRQSGGFRDMSVANEYNFDILSQAIALVHKRDAGKVLGVLQAWDKPQKEGGQRARIKEYALGGKVPEVYRDLAKKAGIEIGGKLDAANDF